MNKKLIISLATIIAVAAIGIGATTAFFSNTEKSVGNTFIAGAIDLKVDSTCHYNGNVCVDGHWQGNSSYPTGSCTCTWQATNLDGQALFNFTDIKPGDEGEDTISLHVDSNPAWVCAEISNVVQTENGCNTPEGKVDITCDNPGLGQGELLNNLVFSIWMDNGGEGGVACDNIKNGSETYLIENAKATDLKWPIADSQHGSPILDSCIGVAWSVPASVNNIIQGDSVTGDITFSAYQARNNTSFLCNPPQLFCGDGIVNGSETCERPDTLNNSLCSQSTTHCVDNKLQTRDAFGDCNGICGCNYDEFSAPACVIGSCGATCVVNADCVDTDPNTTDTCNTDTCSCNHTYVPSCGNYIIDSGEQCDDGNIQAGDGCSATCQTEYAYIAVVKEVVNNEVGTKSAGDFQMTIDTVNAAQNTPISVTAGAHTVSETNTYGYVKTYSGDCDVNGQVTAVYNQTKTCTVTNTMPYFTVTVTKVIVNNNGGNNVIGDFNLFVGASGVTSGVSKKVAVGTYLISESGVNGYAATFSGDCDSNTQLLTGANGDVKTCTITNDDIVPVVTLVKHVVGGTKTANDFIMRVDGVPVPSAGSKTVTANAGHTITEDAMTGYTFTNMTGTGSQGSLCPTTLGGTVILNEGEVITCTITNTAI